jgi:hypothetical protein
MPSSLDPDATLPPDAEPPRSGGPLVRATMWPTRTLAGRERWFDELYVWTEGAPPGTMQRARIQLDALRTAFALLAEERCASVGATLSFGTVERCLDLVTEVFDRHRLLCHRVKVLLRGQVERIRSPYRVQAFIEWLRSQQVPVGYRLTAPRIGMEMKAIDFVRPDFAKVMAPRSTRLDFWQDALLEARAAGIHVEWLIVAGLEADTQKKLAREAGFRFGQGSAVRRNYPPPATRLASGFAPAPGPAPSPMAPADEAPRGTSAV